MSASVSCIDSTIALFTGPLFESSTSTLHFVDIVDKKAGALSILGQFDFMNFIQVYHVNTQSQELSVDEVNEPVTCLALRPNNAGVTFFSSSIDFGA